MAFAASTSWPAASIPGEAATQSTGKPIDLAHLARQTLGDRNLQREVLALFRDQAVAVDQGIDEATPEERRFLAHALRGSAAGIGAFALSQCATELEHDPESDGACTKLRASIADTLRFITEIGT
ncbi:Hpt domain-containing protein [Tianweitania sediminis]|uniref:Hpt domain-containing protein n=1 Tax=Tianweitania sediminis TaxID=1502156 RepID=A0A8J7RM93_9HYPH|nr:Hpt domain-containing protein [Tianweitania sediminis]MBP0439761.1 Hpt domain-containing protein [Tianweitania sediminis]